MRLHYLQHVPFEGIGNIEQWAKARACALGATRMYADEKPPEVDAFDLLVVMGGPMNVDDEDRHPFLGAEKRFIERALDAGKPILGICLGSQLVASVLGARVVRNVHDEIGWFAVEKTSAVSSLCAAVPDRFTTFHWHGDTFELPAGATRVFSSQACVNQGFVYDNRVVALQFHPEVTSDGVRDMLANEGDEIGTGPFVQTAADLLDPSRPYAENARITAAILDWLHPVQ